MLEMLASLMRSGRHLRARHQPKYCQKKKVSLIVGCQATNSEIASQ